MCRRVAITTLIKNQKELLSRILSCYSPIYDSKGMLGSEGKGKGAGSQLKDERRKTIIVQYNVIYKLDLHSVDVRDRCHIYLRIGGSRRYDTVR